MLKKLMEVKIAWVSSRRTLIATLTHAQLMVYGSHGQAGVIAARFVALASASVPALQKLRQHMVVTHSSVQAWRRKLAKTSHALSTAK
jgi:hypothetical protein